MKPPKNPMQFDASSYVGIEQYQRCMDAVHFYKNRGYEFANVPWAVNGEALSITKPPRLPLDECPHFNAMYPVASAEQSFLALQIEYMKTFAEKTIRGRHVALTPCFRNEPDYDSLHRPYFLKVELINWDSNTPNLFQMMEEAHEFFSQFVNCDIVENREDDPLAIHESYDIVSRRKRIELGSYGIRRYKGYLDFSWVYGTGCAEPRLTYARAMEAKFSTIDETQSRIEDL